MICGTCGKLNGDQLVFCEDCGARLHGRSIAPPGGRASLAPRAPIEGAGCTACGTVNPFGMRFCMSCGRSLDARPSMSPRPPQVAQPVIIPMATPAPPVAESTRPCGRCANAIAVGSLFCRFCGAPAAEAPVAAAPPEASAIAAQPIAPIEIISVSPTPRVAPMAQAAVDDAAGNAASPAAPEVVVPRLNAMSTLVMQALEAAPDVDPLLAATSFSAAPTDEEPAPQTAAEGAHDSAARAESDTAAIGQQVVTLQSTVAQPAPSDDAPAARAPATDPAAVAPFTETPADLAAAFTLVAVARDGTEAGRYRIAEVFDVGRSEADLCVPDDRYLAPRHVRFSVAGDELRAVDLGTANGVYLRLRGEAESAVRDQELILLGQQVLRLEIVTSSDESFGAATQHGTLLFGTPALPVFARLSQRTTEAVTRDVFHVRSEETVLGRESGDIVFTADAFMSRRHAALRKRDGEFFIADLGSSNGTFLQIRGQVSLQPGDELRVGQQLYRIDGAARREGGSGE